jgi:LmbE family N-acetylglucosaminyl deacetylase
MKFFIILILLLKVLPVNAQDEWPAIFYAPHADDEAIGLAMGIAEHKQANRPVYLVLVSSGHNSELLKIMNGQALCPLSGRPGWENHPKYHNYNLTLDQLDFYRRAEFIQSGARLGVDKIFILNNGEAIPDRAFYSATEYPKAINTIKDFIKRYPNASHKLVSGIRDRIQLGNEWATNNTHVALYEAADQVRKEVPMINDFRFYRIYVYDNPDMNQASDKSDYVIYADQSLKNKQILALNEYKVFNPTQGRYALGYHSVPNLIDKAASNNYIYLDVIK